MLKLEKRTKEIKDFVEKAYKIFGCEEARASAVFIEDGREVYITSFRTAEPARVTVDDKGNVEILLRQSIMHLNGMIFNLLKGLIKIGMEENGYHLKEEVIREDFAYFDFSF